MSSSTSGAELRAFVVGHVDLGESDRLLRLLSAESGRISVVARRARSSRRRFAGLHEMGTEVALVVKGRGLPSVISGEVVRAPSRARAELERVALLAYGAELCGSLAPEHQPAPRLFRLMQVWCEVLEGDAPPGPASRVALEAKALTFAGLTPSLVQCARCGRPLDDPAVWDPEEGGGLHAGCGGGQPVWARLLVAVERLRRTPLADTTELREPLPWILADFAQHHLGRPIRSRSFLEQLA